MNASEFINAIQEGMRKVIFGSVYVFPLDTVVESMVYGAGEVDDDCRWGTTFYLSITLSHRNFIGGQRTFEGKLGRIPYPSPPTGESQLFYSNSPEGRKKADAKAMAKVMKIQPDMQAYVVNNYLTGSLALEPLRTMFDRALHNTKSGP